jgi:23S rRNA-/tRNA-specific pseudouridylate synthase
VHIRYESARLLVVDKPSSIPVHPCGNYRHNSLIYILAKEHGLKKLHVLHRLDAVTSGLLLLAKDSHTARQIGAQITNKQVRKEYVARVQGRFPDEWVDKVLSTQIYQWTANGQAVLSTTPPPAEVVAATEAAEATAAAAAAADPSLAPARRTPLQQAEAAKEAITVFSFLSYDEESNTSLVKCQSHAQAACTHVARSS